MCKIWKILEIMLIIDKVVGYKIIGKISRFWFIIWVCWERYENVYIYIV